jgi:hypothetical protein
MPYQAPSSALRDGLDPSGTVTIDLPCRKCAYNLRGLNINGRCPECGTAVGYSAQGDLIRFSDPEWVDNLRRGIKLILLAVLVIVLMIVVSAVLGAIGAGRALVEVVSIAMALGANVLSFIGSWLLTEPDPSGLGESEYGTARKVIRVTLLIGVAGAVVQIVERIASPPPAIHLLLQLISGIASLAGVVGLFAQLQYLGKLALRIPADNLAARARLIKWGLGISYGVVVLAGILTLLAARGGAGARHGGAAIGFGCFTAIAGLTALIFLIMYLLLLDKLGRAFKEQASIARQTWAASAASAV